MKSVHTKHIQIYGEHTATEIEIARWTFWWRMKRHTYTHTQKNPLKCQMSKIKCLLASEKKAANFSCRFSSIPLFCLSSYFILFYLQPGSNMWEWIAEISAHIHFIERKWTFIMGSVHSFSFLCISVPVRSLIFPLMINVELVAMLPNVRIAYTQASSHRFSPNFETFTES